MLPIVSFKESRKCCPFFPKDISQIDLSYFGFLEKQEMLSIFPERFFTNRFIWFDNSHQEMLSIFQSEFLRQGDLSISGFKTRGLIVRIPPENVAYSDFRLKTWGNAVQNFEAARSFKFRVQNKGRYCLISARNVAFSDFRFKIGGNAVHFPESFSAIEFVEFGARSRGNCCPLLSPKSCPI